MQTKKRSVEVRKTTSGKTQKAHSKSTRQKRHTITLDLSEGAYSLVVAYANPKSAKPYMPAPAKAPLKPIQLQLTSGGKTIGKMDLPPVLQLRLRAFAFSNGGVGLLEMIDLCLRHTTAPENKSPDLMCPDEEDILDLAAGMLVLMGE